MTAFAVTGIPNRRVEAWKYTDLANLLDPELQPVSEPESVPAPNPLFAREPNRLIFSDGFLKQVRAQDSIEVVDLAHLGTEAPGWVRENLGKLAGGPDQPLGAASLGLMRGGAAIRICSDASLVLDFSNPVSTSAAMSHCRILIVVDSAVALRLVEIHTGADARSSLRNFGMELLLNPQSRLEHLRLQKDSPDAVHVTSVGATLGRDSQYRACYAALGGSVSRLDINVRLAEPNSEAVLHSVAALDAGIADITSVMDHASPHSRSRQLFKNVVGGRGRVINQGRVIVREGSVKSDSHQLFKALLLSPRAEADAKPELEIFADDVLCGHGTAIGALDDDSLFYLRSRGIPEQEAKLVLIRAFLAEAVEGFVDEDTRASLMSELEGALMSAVNAPP
jgi:Fe-S cluster assembly protein SufD